MPQNFQNWMGIDSAPQALSSPSGMPGTEFQDWSNLTGPSDLMKKSVGIPNSYSAGVVPPQNWGQAIDQAIAPFQQKFENVSNAVSQLGQGNTFGAYSAYKGQKPAVGQQAQTAEPSNNGEFDFSR